MALDSKSGTLEVEQRNGVARIRLLGEHDLATVGALRDEIELAAVADHGLVVSLTDTDFIDSSIAHALVVGDRMLRAKGRRLVLHVATASIVRRVLEIFQLDTALPNADSLAEATALASVRESD